jgi:4-amino-4-deoxy-L-arabinose transferase-like glycosyltransferase
VSATLSPPRPRPPSHRAVPPTARADRPAWVRPALAVLLVGTAVLYLWGLSASGYANEYYAAAVQAGTQSLKAWLFGSLDPGNAITVDKPPAALWVMTASARLFGFSSWSLLVPQALMGVASVALLYGAVRRWAGSVAGLIAGAALALTPAAVLMFRFDNPDALLTLLLVAGGYAVVRAVDAASVRASTWWLVAAGAAVGFGFLAKMGQALLVVPAFGLVYLVAGPTRLRTRLLQLGAALVAVVVSAGWYIALVELWPAADRPYIGGSTTNSLLELALGYNGIGRLLGGSGNGGGGGPGGSGNTAFGGAAGITRLFTGEIALEVSWLLPAALVLLVAGIAVTLRAPRTDRLRAALLLWGGWTLVTGVVFSFMSGTMHPYYTVALAPGIAALVGVGAVAFWRRPGQAARLTLSLAAAATAAWAFVLLASSEEAFAWVRWVVLAAGVVAVGGLLVGGQAAGGRRPESAVGGWRRGALVGVGAVVAAVVVGLAVPSAYAVTTAATAHSGSIPSVGTSASAMGGPGGSGQRGGPPPWQNDAADGAAADAAATSDAATTDTSSGAATSGVAADAATTSGAAGPGGGMGGGMGGATSAELTALLSGTTSTWSAAVSSAQSAAALELASGTAVMSTGGWSGSDAAVTLTQFQAAVANAEIHYYVDGGQGGGPGGGSDSTSAQIAAWVEANYTAATVGGQTVYDLTA